MYYLSFDIANKSLACSLVCFNKKNMNYENMNSNSNSNSYCSYINSLTEFDNKLNKIIDYKYYNVEDLIPNKKLKDTNIFERTKNLKIYIKKVKNIIKKLSEKNKIDNITVLVEYQMSSNYNANSVYNQIIYAFSDNDFYKIVSMNSIYKNKIYFRDDLKHSNFIQKYNNNYIANKNHTKANFLYFLKSFNLENIIDNIKSKNIDDLADSFLQIFGYIKFVKK